MESSQEKTTDFSSIGPKIAVMGVGGAGGNAVDNMMRSNLAGVKFLVCNTDAQALSQSLCPENDRICLGFGITQGLGAGSSPDMGRLAAEESVEEVMERLKGTHMLFITAGMGGGTGTGAAPILAQAAKKMGILTIGVVTKPFHFEGIQRMRVAEKGIEAIRDCVDTLLVIPNQNLFRLATQNTTFIQAFAMADEVLNSGVRTFTDLMIKPGLVNSDFADICTVMRDMKGKAMMGTGEASGEGRATAAAEKAIACLLLDDVSIYGAQAVLINVTGGLNLTLYDVDEAIGRIKQEVDVDIPGRAPTQIIFGATFDEVMNDTLRVSVVATGIQDPESNALQNNAANGESGGTAHITHNTAYNNEGLGASYATLGSRHGDYAFDTPAPSFSLREDIAPAFGLNGEILGAHDASSNASHTSPHNTGNGVSGVHDMGNTASSPSLKEKSQKPSWFGRLWGKRPKNASEDPSVYTYQNGTLNNGPGHNNGAPQNNSVIGAPLTMAEGTLYTPESSWGAASASGVNLTGDASRGRGSSAHNPGVPSGASGTSGYSIYNNNAHHTNASGSSGEGGHNYTYGLDNTSDGAFNSSGSREGAQGRYMHKNPPTKPAPEDIPAFLRPQKK